MFHSEVNTPFTCCDCDAFTVLLLASPWETNAAGLVQSAVGRAVLAQFRPPSWNSKLLNRTCWSLACIYLLVDSFTSAVLSQAARDDMYRKKLAASSNETTLELWLQSTSAANCIHIVVDGAFRPNAKSCQIHSRSHFNKYPKSKHVRKGVAEVTPKGIGYWAATGMSPARSVVGLIHVPVQVVPCHTAEAPFAFACSTLTRHTLSSDTS